MSPENLAEKFSSGKFSAEDVLKNVKYDDLKEFLDLVQDNLFQFKGFNTIPTIYIYSTRADVIASIPHILYKAGYYNMVEGEVIDD